ncbi:MAG: L,D-transpeptidase [Candidatus Hydrogenedentes bacterium]|nr:L,D-transpeptidase [Candidatus Hydrogenedentota bacterium]
MDDSSCKQEEPTPLTPEQESVLDTHFWDEWVGESLGVWVSVDEQVLRIIRNRTILCAFPCATAEKGTGFIANSMQTPLGWHSVKTKVGEGAPWGQVFRGAKAVSQVWKPGDPTKEDLVLTRLLWLTGEEPGVNQGGNVDSYNRFIYIHGTNDEARIGTPSSHGCVRLKNDDVIKAFDLIPKGARVLISEQAKPSEGAVAQNASPAP